MTAATSSATETWQTYKLRVTNFDQPRQLDEFPILTQCKEGPTTQCFDNEQCEK